jgi:hypothetical protein
MSRKLIGRPIISSSLVIPDKPLGDPNTYPENIILEEMFKCATSPHYFINNYCHILDDRTRQWVLFKLYPSQINILTILANEQYVILCKTRQVGASTLVAAYDLWLMLFEDNTHTLMLSRGEREAQALLTYRFKPMLLKLPYWMQPKSIPSDSKSQIEFSTGDLIMSLPTSGGDSFTVRSVLIDEAALVHRSRTPLAQVLLNVQPTADAGGQMFLVSKADKSRPKSTFNTIFQEAIKGKNEFYPIFAPWYAVPRRDKVWYNRQKRISLSIDGTLDHLHESFPNTWEEAMAPRTLDKRLNFEWCQQCYVEKEPLRPSLNLPGLKIFVEPNSEETYIIVADAAEGNPQSDPSVAHVYNWETGEQCLTISGRFEVATFAEYVAIISTYYGMAPIFVERNNHGHAVINELLRGGAGRVLTGPDSTPTVTKYGYLTTPKSKAQGYVELSNRLRDKDITVYDHETYRQLTILEGSTLRAPRGEHDDHAICSMLYAAAKKYVHLTMVIGFV